MKILVFALFMGILIANDEFIISYKALVENHILIGEEYNVSKALSLSKDYKVIGICDFIPESHKTNDMESNENSFRILKENKDIVLDCLQKYLHIKIRDDARFINNALHSKIAFELQPQRILAVFDGNKMNIQIIEKIK
ncbi:hypothetical protein CCY99_04790 [Helicobacter sp. 16-1353]|uniref:hypothetical protein n=1 Tax=Helicobacter sp. 16-1353 TaxID=2004996 RepID=UPI000DCD2769|nr:hypothetical protein [Helicobacter sp. 16-1353]RAX54003.1 hypothetical protein CCY99_04790 [Helicobacter sp. 16-1353]